MGGLDITLRADTFTVQDLNKTGVNYSFVPSLTPSRALPLTQHLGDITLRVQPATSDAGAAPWTYFASAWGPGTATAKVNDASPHRS